MVWGNGPNIPTIGGRKRITEYTLGNQKTKMMTHPYLK